jgi:hypothetical protein
MTRMEIRNCLRTLQVVPTIPDLTEEQVRELLEQELIVRAGRTAGAGAIRLTTRGVFTKTGEI